MSERTTHVPGDRPRAVPRDPGPLPDRGRRRHGGGRGRQPGRHGRRDVLVGLARPATHRVLPRHELGQLRAAQDRGDVLRQRPGLRPGAAVPPDRDAPGGQVRRRGAGGPDHSARPSSRTRCPGSSAPSRRSGRRATTTSSSAGSTTSAVERSTLPAPVLPGRLRTVLDRVVHRRPRPRADPGRPAGRDRPLRGREPQHRVRRSTAACSPRSATTRCRCSPPTGRAVAEPVASRTPAAHHPAARRGVHGRTRRPAEVDDWLSRAPEGRRRPPGALRRRCSRRSASAATPLLAAEPDAAGAPRAGAVRVRGVRPTAAARACRAAGDRRAGRPLLPRPRAGRGVRRRVDRGAHPDQCGPASDGGPDDRTAAGRATADRLLGSSSRSLRPRGLTDTFGACTIDQPQQRDDGGAPWTRMQAAWLSSPARPAESVRPSPASSPSWRRHRRRRRRPR